MLLHLVRIIVGAMLIFLLVVEVDMKGMIGRDLINHRVVGTDVVRESMNVGFMEI
jgi:hypothetical protein